jgi:type I restriction-modification system DNA methylase subunit
MKVFEADTDLWVYDMLSEAGLKAFLSPQGSGILEINSALSTASKSKTGQVGFPEYIGVVKDYLIVIENKSNVNNHIFLDENGLICEDTPSVKDFAVNGAVYYGKHLAKNTTYKKIFALGISGLEKRHRITPVFINERGVYSQLDDLETLISFNESNIDEYYTKMVLNEETDYEKRTEEIIRDAGLLHEDLRNYGHITDPDKPLIVSGILLALSEIAHKNFSIDNLIGDKRKTDGSKIYDAIKDNLDRANVKPQVKKDKLLAQFSVIRDNTEINEVNISLGKTPIKHFTEFLYKKIFRNITYSSSSEDILGRFYSEFMSYSGGDGQTLGIVLTPKHICELFCDLIDLKSNDVVFDPCCGTGGFLIAAMHNMLEQVEISDNFTRAHIKQEQLHGVELQSYMFTIATTNMIIRGDGKSNLNNENFLKQNPSKLQVDIQATVGMMNPPYSQGSKANPELYELNFVEQLLNSLVKGGRAIVIVPQSSFTGKTKEEKAIKSNILRHHTLEGVITLNKNTFYGVGTNPCIAIFTCGIPHNKDKRVKFINFEDDGFEVQKHRGLIKTAAAKDKKAHLLDVWFERVVSETKFCVETKVEETDEWLHSFYYFNDEIPSDDDFFNTMADYLTFEFNMITHGKGYLFGIDKT